MAVGKANVFPGFSFQDHQLLFSHASTEVKGEITPELEKVRLNRGSNSQRPGHESDTLITEPPGQG